jgi:hypothetical protein
MAFRGKSYQRIDKLHDAQADEYATAEALQEAAELATAAIAAAVQIPSIGNREIAMLPHMGQGANQAIEDGMALATLMRGTDAADVAEVLLRYQGLRHDHSARVQQGSRANGMRMDAGQAITIGQSGVHDYDVEAEARAMTLGVTR